MVAGRKWVDRINPDFLAAKLKASKNRLEKADQDFCTLLTEARNRFSSKAAFIARLKQHDITERWIHIIINGANIRERAKPREQRK
jgi:hypothetical protein